MKRILSLLTVLLLLAALCLPAAAAEDPLPYVCDTVPLLTDAEWESLESQASRLTTMYQCGVYFITVGDYTDYGDGSIYDVAKAIYQVNDLGWGEEKSGVLLLLSMAERDYTLIAYGYGNTAFTDYGKDYLSEQFLDDFGDDDWAGGCEDYLVTCGEMLRMARNGEPMDFGSQVRTWHLVLISLAIGFVLAFALCSSWRRACRKKTATAREAAGYLAGDMTFTQRSDRYVRTTQTRTKIERSSDSSSGGSGGTTVDHDGFSGTSGKF